MEPKPKRPKETYRATYKRGGMVLPPNKLPQKLPWTPDGWIVDSIEVTAAGALDNGMEFQEFRVVVREEVPQ